MSSISPSTYIPPPTKFDVCFLLLYLKDLHWNHLLFFLLSVLSFFSFVCFLMFYCTSLSLFILTIFMYRPAEVTNNIQWCVASEQICGYFLFFVPGSLWLCLGWANHWLQHEVSCWWQTSVKNGRKYASKRRTAKN